MRHDSGRSPRACAARAGAIRQDTQRIRRTAYHRLLQNEIQLPEELFERLKAYLKKNNLKQKQFIIGLIEDALEQDEEDPAVQPETEEADEPDMDAEEE